MILGNNFCPILFAYKLGFDIIWIQSLTCNAQVRLVLLQKGACKMTSQMEKQGKRGCLVILVVLVIVAATMAGCMPSKQEIQVKEARIKTALIAGSEDVKSFFADRAGEFVASVSSSAEDLWFKLADGTVVRVVQSEMTERFKSVVTTTPAEWGEAIWNKAEGFYQFANGYRGYWGNPNCKGVAIFNNSDYVGCIGLTDEQLARFFQ